MARRWYRVTRAQDDAAHKATVPTLWEHGPANRVPDPPQGPETVKAGTQVDTLVRGLAVPVRKTDPVTAKEAAAAAKAGNAALLAEIRSVVEHAPGPLTRFEIADRVLARTDRWPHDSVRTACAPARGAGLRVVDKLGLSPHGRAAERLSL